MFIISLLNYQQAKELPITLLDVLLHHANYCTRQTPSDFTAEAGIPPISRLCLMSLFQKIFSF